MTNTLYYRIQATDEAGHIIYDVRISTKKEVADYIQHRIKTNEAVASITAWDDRKCWTNGWVLMYDRSFSQIGNSKRLSRWHKLENKHSV